MTTAHRVLFAKAVLTLTAWVCLGVVTYGVSQIYEPAAWIGAGLLGLAVAASIWRSVFDGKTGKDQCGRDRWPSIPAVPSCQ